MTLPFLYVFASIYRYFVHFLALISFLKNLIYRILKKDKKLKKNKLSAAPNYYIIILNILTYSTSLF